MSFGQDREYPYPANHDDSHTDSSDQECLTPESTSRLRSCSFGKYKRPDEQGQEYPSAHCKDNREPIVALGFCECLRCWFIWIGIRYLDCKNLKTQVSGLVPSLLLRTNRQLNRRLLAVLVANGQSKLGFGCHEVAPSRSFRKSFIISQLRRSASALYFAPSMFFASTPGFVNECTALANITIW